MFMVLDIALIIRS